MHRTAAKYQFDEMKSLKSLLMNDESTNSLLIIDQEEKYNVA